MRRHAPGLALAAMIAASALIRVWVNRPFQGPQILCDEYIYAGVARRFATTGHLSLGGGPAAGGSLLYSVLIAPAWLAHKMTTTYGLAKVINATSASLIAVPVYLWARRVVPSWWALLASALVLLLPGLVLSGMLMSESASLPIFTFALFTIGVAVERPTLSRQALVAVALPIAYGVRAQGLVLLAILPTAVLFHLLLEVRAGVPRADAMARLRRYMPLVAILAVGLLAYLAHSRFSPGRAVGFYHRVATVHYDPLAVLLWTGRHAGEAVLAVGVVPACALLLLCITGLTRGLRWPSERAFVATAAAGVLWFLIQAGAYASAFNHGILERYSMYAFPPLLIAFVFWLAQGLPRPTVETVTAAVSALALASLIVFGVFLKPAFGSAVFSSLTLHVFTRVANHVPGGLATARVVIFVLACAAALSFAAAPAWLARPVLPVAVASLLLLASHSASASLAAGTRGWPNATGPVRDWIDRQVGSSAGTTAYLYTANPSVSASSNVFVNTEFWNRSIGRMFSFGDPQVCPFPADKLRLNDRTGALSDARGRGLADERYLVTDRGLAISGTLIASGGSVVQPLLVYRPARPLRLAWRTVGLYPDTWTGSDASFFQYWSRRPRRGRITVTLSRAGWIGPDRPGNVTLTVRDLKTFAVSAKRRWMAHAGRTASFDLPTPPPPFELAVHVSPTFSPAQFGQADSRQLGVQAKFSYTPSA